MSLPFHPDRCFDPRRDPPTPGRAAGPDAGTRPDGTQACDEGAGQGAVRRPLGTLAGQELPGLEVVLAGVAARQEGALERLYERTHAALLGRLLRLLPDRPRAEAALVDTFVRIWDKAAQFDAQLGSAWAWMLAVARSRAMDLLRDEHKRAARYGSDPDFGTLLDEGDLPEDVLLTAERHRAVRQAVRGLPLDERTLVLRAFFHGRTHAEIAEDEGLPLGTVKSRLRRALARLGTSLAPRAANGTPQRVPTRPRPARPSSDPHES